MSNRMRNVLACLSLSAALAPPCLARAEPYAVLGASPVEGLSVVDVATVRRSGPYWRAWAYVVLPEHKPQRVYLEASELEFDCARKRNRMVSGVRYDDKAKPLVTSKKVEAWTPVAANTPAAGMQRQVCQGAFDPTRLRGQGKTIHQYAAEMRPLLPRLDR